MLEKINTLTLQRVSGRSWIISNCFVFKLQLETHQCNSAVNRQGIAHFIIMNISKSFMAQYCKIKNVFNENNS